ncbi:ABC transporter substrate-binding protein [Methylophaga lonarensis]|uniref:ABC transporter substrate-binding protein n=1 Tax=Methylophaga lonarensis TaxID=999151 RepID=UPI003D2CA19E
MRRYLVSLLLCCLPLTAGANSLTLLSSYPQTMLSHFIEAFEAEHPDIRIDLLWRRPQDALQWLDDNNGAGTDVVWLPSWRAFQQLKQQDFLQPLSLHHDVLPAALGDFPLHDSDNAFIASEMAGYGLFFVPDDLERLNLKAPKRWQELTDFAWYQHIALPVPSQVGYAPMLIDQLLQAEGWQAGWSQWLAIAANSRLIGRGSDFVTDQVLQQRASIGLTLDFFAESTIASGGNGQFVYPEQTAFNPAPIGILKRAGNVEAAELFVKFVISHPGQTLLLHPDIRKKPVNPQVYAGRSLVNPFALELQTAYNFDQGLQRREFNSALFDATITDNHQLLTHVWQAIHALPASQQPPLRQQLLNWPVNEPDNNDANLQACQQRHDNNEAEQQCQAFQQHWQQRFQAHYQQLLDHIQSR